MNFAFLTTTESGSLASMLPMLALMFVVFYFFLIRPQKKREKAAQEMRSSIEVGDEVVTIGGIVGIVVGIKDDTFVLETGSDRAKLRFNRWAVQQNVTASERAAEAKAAAKAAKDAQMEKAKEEKAAKKANKE